MVKKKDGEAGKEMNNGGAATPTSTNAEEHDTCHRHGGAPT